MSISITKRFEFAAAHQLPWHAGKCSRLHGHNYTLEVTVSGPLIPDEYHRSDSGMVMDFGDLKGIVKPWIEQTDHTSLNALMVNPTAERMLQWFGPVIADALPPTVSLVRLRLYETPDSWAEWTPTS